MGHEAFHQGWLKDVQSRAAATGEELRSTGCLLQGETGKRYPVSESTGGKDKSNLGLLAASKHS